MLIDLFKKHTKGPTRLHGGFMKTFILRRGPPSEEAWCRGKKINLSFR